MKNHIKLFFSSLVIISGLVKAQNFSSDETYTYSRTYLEPVTYPNLNNNVKQIQAVQYTDGLGRPKQDIAIGATYSGQDMVTGYFYEPVTGRQTKQYLPVTMTSTSGALQGLSEADINSFYGTSNAYAEVRTENSPLSRPVETAAPGETWKIQNGKTKKVEYLFNAANEVKKYTAVSDDDESVFYPVNGRMINYAANTLHKIVTTDEDGNISVVYKNSMGQTLMTRQDNGAEKLDTYYVYNQYGQLVMIIPPKASALGILDQTAKDQLCYIYRYDAKGRLIEKKLPGKGREEMVYDKADRLILYRDANIKAQNQWLLTKYDQFGRVIYTGFHPNVERANIQNVIADVVITESPNSTGFTKNGLQVYYSNNYFIDINTVLSVNYYDEYPADAPAKPLLITETALSSDNLAARSTKTMPTASYVKNISDDRWTKTYYWYDERGRSIGAQEINHLGGITTTHTEQDWAGITTKVETDHQRTANAAVVKVKERFVYNARNYLEEHYHQVDNRPEELLAKYTYNELGQVTNKQVGNNLQSIDYSYNIRGWLTGINDMATMGSKLFAYKINYDQRDGLETPNLDYPNHKVQPRYNGNITETVWKTVETIGEAPATTPQRQGYVYDKANRLLAGFYQLPDNAAAKANSEIIEEYDKNGNIIKLKRTGARQKGQVKLIDNLTYTVEGNRIASVTDTSGNLSGYEGGGGTIGYDPNGNMTSMPDKGIASISYNFLNLPEEITQTNVSTFYYRADGVKLRKKFVLNNAAGSNTINTEYLDGFVYTTTRLEAMERALAVQDTETIAVKHARQEEVFTEPAEALVVQPPADPQTVNLAYFPTAEGYYDYQNSKYIYQYKDYLGNVRLSYAKNSDTNEIEILDRNDYYPFGMNMQGNNSSFDTMGSVYNYKYNQKELQETGFYDYGWRQYMPDLGRWFGMDQLSEKYNSFSPYAYVTNNPVMFLDPDGRDKAPSTGNWLQDMWNNTTSYSSWTNTGNGSFKGGEIGMSSDQFTSFYNFLSSGGTGSYTYWTNAPGHSTMSSTSAGIDVSVQGLIANNITIKGHQDSSWDTGKDWLDNSSKLIEGTFGFVKDQRTALYNSGYWVDNLGNTRSVNYAGRARGSLIGLRSDYVRTTARFGKFAKGAGWVGYAINAYEVGDGAFKDYREYRTNGVTDGRNTTVAAAKAVTGIAVGAGVGAGTTWLTGAIAGAVGGSVAPGVGTVIGFIVGGVAGYYASDYVGGVIENSYR